jgi:hypothetical protein
MTIWHRAFAPALLLLLCACPKKTDATGDGGADAAAADAAPAKAAAAPGTRAIDGVGDVPEWSSDKAKGKTKCKTAADAKARIAKLDRGDDAKVSDGTADVAEVMKATALNDGGYHHYGKKEYDIANRWWRAALTVRPSMILARYNLTCGLALAGKPKDSIWALTEIGRAADDGDAKASNMLEKAKSDEDLKSVRTDPDFKAALRESHGGLVGPRNEPETAALALPLLPEEYRKIKDQTGVQEDGVVHYKPGVTHIWTWRPDAQTELLVATIIDDPAKAGKPKFDNNQDYGAISVWKRTGGKLTMLLAKKTGELPPSVSAGKGGTVKYTYDAMCGTLHGTLSWDGKAVSAKETECGGGQ